MLRVVEVQPVFNPLQPEIHLRLQGFLSQVVAAQIVDVFPYPDELTGVVCQGGFYFCLSGL